MMQANYQLYSLIGATIDLDTFYTIGGDCEKLACIVG